MRGKCPMCKAVFEIKPSHNLVYVGIMRFTKCPACGRQSVMNNFVSDPITWPAPEGSVQETSSD
jgi:hypothetical protein